jgi:hypothetical protein
MTYMLKLRRYSPVTTMNTMYSVMIPVRVTITGTEDHFARAYEDAHMVIAGMRAMDALREEDRDKEGKYIHITYDILSLARS